MNEEQRQHLRCKLWCDIVGKGVEGNVSVVDQRIIGERLVMHADRIIAEFDARFPSNEPLDSVIEGCMDHTLFGGKGNP